MRGLGRHTYVLWPCEPVDTSRTRVFGFPRGAGHGPQTGQRSPLTAGVQDPGVRSRTRLLPGFGALTAHEDSAHSVHTPCAHIGFQTNTCSVIGVRLGRGPRRQKPLRSLGFPSPTRASDIVGADGIEPSTSAASGQRSPAELSARVAGHRTDPRRRRESNPGRGFCRPLPNHSATSPRRRPVDRPRWSGRPGSNRRPQPWQGCALPAELRPHERRWYHPGTGYSVRARRAETPLTPG